MQGVLSYPEKAGIQVDPESKYMLMNFPDPIIREREEIPLLNNTTVILKENKKSHSGIFFPFFCGFSPDTGAPHCLIEAKQFYPSMLKVYRFKVSPLSKYKGKYT